MRRRDLEKMAAAQLQVLGSRAADLGNRHIERFVRLITVPDLHPELAEQMNGQKGREVRVACPRSTATTGSPPESDGDVDAVIPPESLRNCLRCAPLGEVGLIADGKREPRLLFIAFGSGDAESAALDFAQLAEDAGKTTQLLRPGLAPVEYTTSSQNLWCTWLFFHLRGTAWVHSGVQFESIDAPFGASCELIRRFLFGTDGKGKIFPGPAELKEKKGKGTAVARAIRVRPKKDQDRNYWIYRQAIKGTPYKEIASELAKIAKKRGWAPVTSKQGIRKIAFDYADEHNLPRPAPRRDL